MEARTQRGEVPEVTAGSHFERVAVVYESLRTTDEAPVRRIGQLLPDRSVTALDIGCGTGRYTRLLRWLLPEGSRLVASDVSAAMLAELTAGEPVAYRGRRDRRDDAAGGCMTGQFRAAPAGQRRPARSRQLTSQGLYPGHDPGGKLAWPAGPRGISQPVPALFAVPAPPFAGGILADSQLPRDRVLRRAAGCEQHNPRPHDHPVRRRPAPGNGLQFLAAGLAQRYGTGTGRHGAPAVDGAPAPGRDPGAAGMQAAMVRPGR